MFIRCSHCRYRFSMESLGLLHEFNGAVCPSCGRETEVVEDHDEVAPTSEPSNNHPKVMVRAEEPEPLQEWMILKENGKVYGPFAREVVVTWIEERKINAAEEVSPDGLEWWTFGEHEEFAHYFEVRLAGLEVPEARSEDLRFRRRTPLRDFLRGAARTLFAFAFVAGVGAGVWHSATAGWLVVPEAWIERLLAETSSLLTAEELPASVSSPDPSDLFLAELMTSHADTEGSSWELLMRGRHLLLEDTDSSLRAARPLLERAVVLYPDSGLALAALAELYNILAGRGLADRDLQRKSIYLLERAHSSQSWQAERLRARATFLAYSDHPEEVEAVVREAITVNPRDPQLHFLMAKAAMGVSGDLNKGARRHFEKTLELDPGFHRVWFELGRAEERRGSLWTAIEHYTKKIELAPSSPATLVRMGVVYEELGQPDRAIQFYDMAIRFNPDEKHAVVRRAVLAYQRDGDPRGAVRLLTDLASNKAVVLDLGESKELWSHLSAAQRLAGDPEAALVTVEKVLAEDPSYAAALFHKALALVAAGRALDALPPLNRADTGGLDNWARAQVLFAEGRAAQAAEQLPAAVDAYDRAIDAYPAFMPAYFWRADVRLALGDPYLSSKELCRHLVTDPLEYARPRVAGLFYDPPPPLEPLVLRMLSVASEQNFAPQLHAAAGVLLFHDGRFEQASRLFKKTLSQDERNEIALFYEALSSYKQGRFAKAVEQFELLLGVSRSNAVFHVYFADVLLELGRLKPAIAGFSESFGFGVRSAWVHGRLAEAYAADEQVEAGRAEIERGLRLDSGSCALAASRFRARL